MIDDIIRPPQPAEAPTPHNPPEPPVVERVADDAAFYARRVMSMSDMVPQREQRPFQDIQRRPVSPMAPRESVVTTTTNITYDTIEQTPQGTKEIYVSISEIETEVMTPEKAAGFYFAHMEPHKGSKGGSPAEASSGKGASRRKDVLRYGASAFAAMLILAFTGYVSLDTWMTNSEVKQVVAQKQETVASGGMILGEGEDETEVKPNAVEAYKVAADLPRVLTVEKLGIRARVLPMSVNADGSMQAPVNIFDSGWYGASAKPGTRGAAVIDAHASGATRQGLFAYLDTLAPGDRLSIERGDGQKFTYEVVFTETVPLESVDMAKLLRPYDTTEGLNLITCAGTWLPEQKTFDHRVVVYTKRV